MIALVIMLISGAYVDVGVYPTYDACLAAEPFAVSEATTMPEAIGVECLQAPLPPVIFVGRPPVIIHGPLPPFHGPHRR